MPWAMETSMPGSQGSPFVFWQQLRQHEASGIDVEEKEEMDVADGELWMPGSLHP